MSKFIGDKKFYKYLFAIVIPIVLQQFITQFVGLLDNLMIGQIGSSEMTGVALANQLLFIFNLGVFGSLSGVSIFASQYYGAKDSKGYLETFRFKVLVGLTIFIITTIIFILFNKELLSFFINSSSTDTTNPEIVLNTGRNYLLIMLVGNIPFIIKEIYSVSLREMKETFVPMLSGIIAIIVNLFFNYLLIFGKLGFKPYGAEGAAIATVISRFVEMIVIVSYTYIKINKYSFFKGAYKKVIKFSSIKKFLPKTLLLTSNELMWSLGLTLILSCYSLRGLDMVAAFNISNTISNLFITISTSLGNGTAIILGHKLGEKDIINAKDTSYKILAFSIVVSLIFMLLMIGCSFFLPNIYKVSSEIKLTARNITIISAFILPINTFNTCCYFTLRAGGKIILTIFFDSLFIILVRVPLAFILAKYTTFSIYIVHLVAYGIDVVKLFIGYKLIDKGIWLNTIV